MKQSRLVEILKAYDIAGGRDIWGRRYSRLKNPHGGTGANQYVQTGQNDTSATANKLAAEHGVSASTIKRDGIQVHDDVDQGYVETGAGDIKTKCNR